MPLPRKSLLIINVVGSPVGTVKVSGILRLISLLSSSCFFFASSSASFCFLASSSACFCFAASSASFCFFASSSACFCFAASSASFCFFASSSVLFGTDGVTAFFSSPLVISTAALLLSKVNT